MVLDGLDGVPSGQRSEVEEYLHRVNFIALERRANHSRAAAAREERSTVVHQCSIDPSRFALGRCSIVFKVRFSDGVVWVSRVHRRSRIFFEAKWRQRNISLISRIYL